MLQKWGKHWRPHSLGSGAQGSWDQDRGSAGSRNVPWPVRSQRVGCVCLSPMARPAQGHCFTLVQGEEAFQHPLVLPHVFVLEVSHPGWAGWWLSGG